MPRPAYILCSTSGAIDRETNQVSHFHVIEKLVMTILKQQRPKRGRQKPMMLARIMPFQIVATWMLSDDDKIGEKYDAEVSLKWPEDEKESVRHEGTFVFDKQFQRFVTAVELGPRETAQSGLLVVRQRIRKTGTKAWMQQECLVPVEVIVKEVGGPESSNGKKRKKT